MSVLNFSGAMKFDGFIKATKKVIYNMFGFVNETERVNVDYGQIADPHNQEYDYGNI